ncbi:flagellar hook capping FlgD N-terminal domain-containing protein [Fulvimonas sp. R45]|uniref:flagellar hook assembly protein FlgD n=1 Tax=Fulvimonas sp. R45 TaxID=3045937 RepID=UPI00265E956C|nr:flagellar hook capping FlgD N-terminal domain-containing protein [Fulvimonas sp. R45]MDO1528337.1 flagellar hook capping FlgD N-terminal domain-containing protein [Fulvimonas sp. R45]
MIDTSNTTGAASGATGGAATPKGTMSQADFLKLMTAQLQAQDPTHPVDNTQFVSQMAQFSQLSATQQLDTDLNTLSGNFSNAAQAAQVINSANLVGREVMVGSDTAAYDGQAVSGGVNVSVPGRVVVTVSDAAGHVVRSIDLGNRGEGLAKFDWDGTDDAGKPVADGSYTLAATSGGTDLATYVAGTVEGVGYGGSGVGTYLQVAGVGGVPLAQVAQIL